jgi:hypothetical protein
MLQAMNTLSPELNQTQQRLQKLGYQLRWREQEWWSCAVLGHGTAVLGHGADREAALEHALGQMLAHPLARTLWQLHLGADLPEDQAIPADFADEPAEADRSPAPAVVADPQVVAGEPAQAPEQEPKSVDAEPVPQSPVPEPEVAPVRPRPATRPVDFARIDDALGALVALEKDIEETQDFALLSAALMRLQLVAWIAVARDWQDRLGDELVTQRVSGLAARMGAIARRYWPGQVAALRLDARPSDCIALVGGEPRSWADVAELAELAMAEATAIDEYGWSDSSKLGAQPRDPRSRLGEAQATLRKLLPGLEEPGSPAAILRAAELRQNPPIKDMAAVARMLRWLRLSADPEPWGRAMGWLRWLTQRLGNAVPPSMAELLLPETLPPRDWAKENGFSPQRGELRKVLAELPAVEAGAEALYPWFLRIYKLFNAEELAERLAGHRELILATDAQLAFPSDGTARDRWRKVQKRLSAPGQVAPLPPPPVPAQEAESADPAEAGPVAKARLLLEGKRALVLGNRADPHLDRHLREGLGFAQLDWCLTDNGSSVDAASDRVRNGGYEVVLGLTGFISHASEAVLRQACAGGGVPFVRAGKGRLVGCAVAVLRDLPVQSE